jgi:hypothetical protein
MEITVSDSEKRSLGAGNAVHRARVIGAKDCVAAIAYAIDGSGIVNDVKANGADAESRRTCSHEQALRVDQIHQRSPVSTSPTPAASNTW